MRVWRFARPKHEKRRNHAGDGALRDGKQNVCTSFMDFSRGGWCAPKRGSQRAAKEPRDGGARRVREFLWGDERKHTKVDYVAHVPRESSCLSASLPSRRSAAEDQSLSLGRSGIVRKILRATRSYRLWAHLLGAVTRTHRGTSLAIIADWTRSSAFRYLGGAKKPLKNSPRGTCICPRYSIGQNGAPTPRRMCNDR